FRIGAATTWAPSVAVAHKRTSPVRALSGRARRTSALPASSCSRQKSPPDAAPNDRSPHFPPLDLPRRCGLLRFTDGAGDAVFAEAGDDAVEGRVQADAGGAARVVEERQLRLGAVLDAGRGDAGQAHAAGRGVGIPPHE